MIAISKLTNESSCVRDLNGTRFSDPQQMSDTFQMVNYHCKQPRKRLKKRIDRGLFWNSSRSSDRIIMQRYLNYYHAVCCMTIL